MGRSRSLFDPPDHTTPSSQFVEGYVRLPPIFDHGSAFLKWNLRSPVPCLRHPSEYPVVMPLRSVARPRRGGPEGRGRSGATA